MAQFSGKYQVIESVNYKEVLMETGLPEDKAKAISDAKIVCTVVIDDKKISLAYESPINRTVTLEFGKPGTEILPTGTEVQSTASIQGNVITVVAGDGKNTFTRTFTFNDSGVEMRLLGGSKEAIRRFKKL